MLLMAGHLTLLWQFTTGNVADELLTMGTMRGWRSREEFEHGLTDSRHGWLRRGPSDSYFPPRCFEAAGLETRGQASETNVDR